MGKLGSELAGNLLHKACSKLYNLYNKHKHAMDSSEKKLRATAEKDAEAFWNDNFSSNETNVDALSSLVSESKLGPSCQFFWICKLCVCVYVSLCVCVCVCRSVYRAPHV